MEQFYYPDGWAGTQLPRDVTRHLAESGYDVEVICGSDQYVHVDVDDEEDPVVSGVRIRRTPKIVGGKDIKQKKLLRQLWFYLAAFPLLLVRRRPDVFVAQTNPPLVVVLVRIAALIHRRPYVLISMDLYPEVLFSNRSISRTSLLGRTLIAVFDWAYKGADQVVALGPTMQSRLEDKGVSRNRIQVISNWATGDLGIVRGDANRLRNEWGLRGCKVLLYSGNLGIAHDLETPIRAYKLARESCPELRLLFVGQGSRKEEAQRIAHELDVADHVAFRPLVPLKEMPHSIGIADLALVTLRPGFEGLVVPSKLLGYMGRGVPTVYVGPPSDAQTILEESGGGVAFANGEDGRLAEFLVRAVNDPARLERMSSSSVRFYRDRLSRHVGLESYRRLIESICNHDGRADRGD